MDKTITAQEFVGRYLDSDKELKNHNLPYGIDYFNLLEQKAQKAARIYNYYWKIINSRSDKWAKKGR